ncbi:putative ribonuclease H-like domain-containing protein [Tanacetum coccineum]
MLSFFAQQASMPTLMMMRLLQIDDDVWKKLTFDGKWLCHFARECRFAKYQENRANGHNEKRIVAIEDSNSKALVATDNNEDIDWTKEFDAEPVTYAMMANEWNGLDDFDWSNKADDAPVSLALMATNSEVPYCSKCIGIESSNSMKEHFIWGDETLTDSAYENFKREKAYKASTSTYSQSAIDRNKVIIEDWVDSDDEETDVSESQKETAFNSENSETSFENRSPNSQNSVGQESRTKGLGNKGGKLCFVCYSPNHLIKDCNLHERTFKHTQTHKPKGTQGSRETRPVWNNIQRVNHSNFARNSRYPHQRRSFIPSAVLTRDGLISTARPKMTQTVPSKSTANVTYQGTARSRVPQAVLSRSTDGSYYPRMDNRRPRISSYSPSSRSSTTRTPHRPQRPKKIVKSIWVKKGSTVGSQAVLPQTVKKSAMISPKQTWKPKGNYLDSVNRGNGSYTLKQFEYGNPEEDLKDYAIIDSGCSGSMTGDKDKLSDFKEFKGGYVAFGNDSKGGRISGKGTIKTSCLDFEKVSYVEELKFNLLSVSQICDKKHNVLFTDKECLILSPKFKFVDEDLVILRAPRKNDVYSLDLKNIIPSGGITCLVAKATEDEAVLWHRRLGHVNFKNINKLVKGNLVRGLPSKTFKLDHSCVACRKGKQHRASCKKIEERTVREPLELLHMDLFGPVSVESINKKKYCLVVTDDCSKFSWVFFLAYKDETYDMLHDLFAVCLCARFQVTPKVSHLHAVKRIFRYLKHQPNLGLWYPKDSPFHLEAFSDSDYAGDNHDRRSTSGGCQYLGRRLVSWQCKKQTIVAISSTEAEYVAAASCCAQVLWMQNQLLDYGFNFMNTEIHIDNESTICIVKNPVFHSKTKHIQIRHHFIRDCYEQRLFNVVKVHTDDNVADLLTQRL